jgi:hypothetical protein
MWRVALAAMVIWCGSAQAEPSESADADEAANAAEEAAAPEESAAPQKAAGLEDPEPAVAAPARPAQESVVTRVAVETRPAPSSHATLRFRNDVGDRFTLVEARFVMDGKPLPAVLAHPERGKGYVVYSGPADAGRHLVTARLTYQGRSRGIFTYTKGYTFKVTSDQVLTTPANRTVGFTVVGKEATGLNAPPERRIAVTVEENAGR